MTLLARFRIQMPVSGRVFMGYPHHGLHGFMTEIVPGRPVLVALLTHPTAFDTGFAGSRAITTTPPDGDVVFGIYSNDARIGALTFRAGCERGEYSGQARGPETLMPDETLRVVAPDDLRCMTDITLTVHAWEL